MEGYKKDWTWTETKEGTEIKEVMSRDDRLFSAIVLADSASPALENAYEALRKYVQPPHCLMTSANNFHQESITCRMRRSQSMRLV